MRATYQFQPAWIQLLYNPLCLGLRLFESAGKHQTIEKPKKEGEAYIRQAA